MRSKNKEIIVPIKSIGKMDEVTKEINAKIIIVKNNRADADFIPQRPDSDKTDFKYGNFEIPHKLIHS